MTMTVTDMTQTSRQDELDAVRHEAQRLLREQVDSARTEALLDQPGSIDRPLWSLVAGQGWPAVALSEESGGAGLGWAGLAVLAEECGRAGAALPLQTNALVAAQLLDEVAAPGLSQARDVWLDRLRDGAAIACLALPSLRQGTLEGAGSLQVRGGCVSGRIGTVAFGAVADVALLAAADEGGALGLWLVALDAGGASREVVTTLDDARGYATLQFDAAPALRIGDAAALARLLDRAATACAFEQLGGAQASLTLAIEHAQQRIAFGQPIAKFQAIKHKLVEIYSAIEIARGCALTALEALDASDPVDDVASTAERREAAAAARLGATQAYELAARDCINVFGALGVTREAQPHRHYRRARALALELGAPALWRERLVDNFLGGLNLSQRPDPSHSEDTPELAAYRATARAWLAEHAPRHSGSARNGQSFEADLALGRAWQALKFEHGYAGITVAQAYGGAGGTELQKLAFAEEEMRYDLPLVYFSVSLSNPLPIFLKYAPEAMRAERSRAALRGDEIWCQMFSEPGAGSDLAALRTRAERDGEGWRLNGQKVWTSWAQIARWGVIVVRTDPTVAKHAGLSYFFIDMQAPGVTVRPIKRLGGEHDLNEVFLDNVYVPDAQRLGEVGAGFRVAIETLMIERYAIVDESGYAPPLEVLARSAAGQQLEGRSALESGEFRLVLAQALVERIGLRNIHRRALNAMIAGREPGPEGSLRKLLLGRSRQRLAALAMDLQGPDALQLPDHARPVTHFTPAWLDPSLRIAGGTDEVLLNTLAERVLGLPQDHRPDKGKPFNQQ